MSDHAQVQQTLLDTVYSRDMATSPYFHNPEAFLKEGDIVQAKCRVYDLPGEKPGDWGTVRAEKGDEGEVVHVEEGYWPTVMFPGGATCVTDAEVEKVA